MFGIPPWAWLLGGIAVTFAVFVCRLYVRFRSMCRTVRDEFTNVIKSTYPQVELHFEANGDLAVRAGDSPGRFIDMASVYSAVARLPGMGRDPAVRARVYQQVLDAHGPL